MANSRLSPRASFFAEVDVLSSAEAMPQRVWGQNLSEAGIFLQTTKPFHPGDRLSLRFDISESEVHVRAAEVVWVKPFEPINVDGTLPGVGVRFLSVDPPTRAAIRRYVHKAAPPQDSDVPTPPPEADLPEGEFMSLESLKPLSLPPFESMSERPAFQDVFESSFDDSFDSAAESSFAGSFEDETSESAAPPMSALQDPAFDDAAFEDTSAFQHSADDNGFDDTAVDTAAPDLGELDDSTLPSQSTMPPDDYLLEATMPPQDVEHPLSGWRFEVLPAERPRVELPEATRSPALQTTTPPDPSFSLDDDEPDVNDTLPPPSETLPPFAVSLPPFELSEPVPVASRTGYSFENEAPDATMKMGTMPAPVSMKPMDAEAPKVAAAKSLPPKKAPPMPPPMTELPSEVFTASLAPLEKQERGPDVFELAAHRRIDQEFFDGKLSVAELPHLEERGANPSTTRKLRVAWAAGLLLAGGGLGVWMGYEPAPAAPVTTAAEARPERVLTVLPAPAVKSVAEAEAELIAKAAREPAAAEVPETPKAAAPKAEVPFVSPETIAVSDEGKLPRKEDVSLTNAVAVTSSAPAAVNVEYGRVTIPVEGGRVARSFGLENPPRVVVDLVDATMPSAKVQELGTKGVARVRFGRPDPVHVRVVVELAGDGMPDGITTLKKASSLSVAWR